MYRWVFMGDYACKTIGTSKDLKEFLTDWNEENSTSYDDWEEFNVLLQTRRMYNDYE